jgi:hypothetical protein
MIYHVLCENCLNSNAFSTFGLEMVSGGKVRCAHCGEFLKLDLERLPNGSSPHCQSWRKTNEKPTPYADVIIVTTTDKYFIARHDGNRWKFGDYYEPDSQIKGWSYFKKLS